MSTVNPSPAPLQPGQRVHHHTFGPGVVAHCPTVGGTAVRVRFDSGHEPLVRRSDLLVIPDGFEPYFDYEGTLADYARMRVGEEFSVEEIMTLDGQRTFWVSTKSNEISPASARELAAVLSDMLDEDEADG